MTVELIKEQIVEILEDICGIQITDVMCVLANDLAMDSLQMVMLLVMIEDTFEIELDESDMNPFALLTVKDAVDLVAKYKIESEGEQNG